MAQESKEFFTKEARLLFFPPSHYAFLPLPSFSFKDLAAIAKPSIYRN